MDLILGSGGSPGEGNGNPFQYSCLGNPMDRGAWRATVKDSDTAERLTLSLSILTSQLLLIAGGTSALLYFLRVGICDL